VPEPLLHNARVHTGPQCQRRVGMPQVVQERLGHAAVEITLDVYSHVARGCTATPLLESPGGHLRDGR
jgi:hypothetical protein